MTVLLGGERDRTTCSAQCRMGSFSAPSERVRGRTYAVAPWRLVFLRQPDTEEIVVGLHDAGIGVDARCHFSLLSGQRP